MRIAICEDEQSFAVLLKEKIEDFFAGKGCVAEISVFSDGESFLASVLKDERYDAVFMDIHLGGDEDGMVVAARLREKADSTPIIFVTSLENRAVDGYDVSAFGFVVKKHMDEKLPVILEKLWKKLYVRKTIAVTHKGGTAVVNTDEILWVESEGRCTLVHTLTGDFTDTHSIGSFVPLLSADNFVEVYKSIYVNTARIRRINADTVTLENDVDVLLSRRNRKNVMYAVMKEVNGR